MFGLGASAISLSAILYSCYRINRITSTRLLLASGLSAKCGQHTWRIQNIHDQHHVYKNNVLYYVTADANNIIDDLASPYLNKWSRVLGFSFALLCISVIAASVEYCNELEYKKE